jgi:hypothetical protein
VITNLEPSDRAPDRGDESGAFVTEHGGERDWQVLVAAVRVRLADAGRGT